MSVQIEAYFAFVKGNDFDLPYRESIRCASEAFDRVVVATDPRFDDETLDDLQKMTKRMANVEVIEEEIDFDHQVPLGEWKTRVRKKLSAEWLVELEPWWLFDPARRSVLEEHLVEAHPSVLCVALGALNLFNGDHIKKEQPQGIPCVSRNHPSINHGSDDRVGMGLQVKDRIPLKPSLMLMTDQWHRKLEDPRAVWIWNYEFYCLPTTYEAKQFWHYFKGKQDGVYTTLTDYDMNLDHEPVAMFSPNYRLPPEMYEHQITVEMRDPSVELVGIAHLPIMDDWLARQRVIVPPRWQSLKKARRFVSERTRRLRWRLKRGVF